MSEFNVVLEGEYKGKKIKRGSFLEIITEGENSKISINKSNVQAYDILDETDKKTFRLGSRNRRKEKRSLSCFY